MGFVYRYIDTNDEIIKYVGIVWATNDINGLKRRIRDHLSDDWNKLGNWRVEYISENICSRTDAEYFEAHYISLYNTGKFFNKSKVGWGKSSFLPSRNDWGVLDLSFLNSRKNIKRQKDPIYVTRYDVASKLISKRKSNNYFINKFGINLLINGLVVAVDNDYYYDEDNGLLYYISNSEFKGKKANGKSK